MSAFRPSLSFVIGTICGVLGGIILFSSRRLGSIRYAIPAISGFRDVDVCLPELEPCDDSGETMNTVSRKLGTVGADANKKLMPRSDRKIFIDCGANTASSVDLFLDTYPDGENTN